MRTFGEFIALLLPLLFIVLCCCKIYCWFFDIIMEISSNISQTMFVDFQLTHFQFFWIFLSFSGVPIFLLYWFVLWLDVIIVLSCIGFSYDVRTELNPIKTDKDHLSTVTGSYVIDQIILQFAAVPAICTFEILKKGKSFHHKLLTLSFEWGPCWVCHTTRWEQNVNLGISRFIGCLIADARFGTAAKYMGTFVCIPD